MVNGLERTKMDKDTVTLQGLMTGPHLGGKIPTTSENWVSSRRSVFPQEQEGEGNVQSWREQGEDSAHDSLEGVQRLRRES